MARIPANKGVYQKTHICPTCGVEFSGPQVRPPGGPLSKQCPAGHWHSMHELSRRVTAAEAQRCAKEIAGMRLRVDSVSIGLMSMVSAYERLQAQFPAGSQARALLDGAFGVPAKIAGEPGEGDSPYGSVAIAEILSAEVVRLRASVEDLGDALAVVWADANRDEWDGRAITRFDALTRKERSKE